MVSICNICHVFFFYTFNTHSHAHTMQIQTDEQCIFTVMWTTSVVCHPLSGPMSSNTCTAKNPKTGHTFNLMPLSDYNHKIPLKNKTEFLINVCKPILHRHEETCPPNTSICFNQQSETDVKKRFKNYGTAVPDPTYENGELFMKFTSPEKCDGSDKNITSIINFVCNEGIQVNSITFNSGFYTLVR